MSKSKGKMTINCAKCGNAVFVGKNVIYPGRLIGLCICTQDGPVYEAPDYAPVVEQGKQNLTSENQEG